MAHESNKQETNPVDEVRYVKYAKAIAVGFATIGVGSIIGGGVLLASNSGIAAMASLFCGGFLLNNSFQMYHKLKRIESRISVTPHTPEIDAASNQKNHNMTYDHSKTISTPTKAKNTSSHASDQSAKSQEEKQKLNTFMKTLHERETSGKKVSRQPLKVQDDGHGF